MTTYYVDATDGDDDALGTSAETAWQTITKVNAAVLAAGDSVLFKRGETWAGAVLTITWSGSASQPITFGAYGSGVEPILDGEDTRNCIWCAGHGYIEFENLHCTRGLPLGFGIGETGGGDPSHDITLTDCIASLCGDDNVSFENRVYSCAVHNLTSYGAYDGSSEAAITCLEIADGCHDILIDGADLYGSEEDGISIHAHSAEQLPWNIEFHNVHSHDNSRYGISIFCLDGGVNPAVPAISFYDCKFIDNEQVGVNMTQVGTGELPSHLLFDRCTIGDSPASYYQASVRGDRHTFRRCVFIGSDRGIIVYDATDGQFYNNTIHLSSSATYPPLLIYGTDNSGSVFRNNILAVDAAGVLCIQVVDGAHAGLDLDYNLYYTPDGASAGRWNWQDSSYTWANWKTNSSQDANSPAPANPLFASVPADDFCLDSGSPAIGAGTDVGLFYSGSDPDCGAFERWASRGVTWLHLAGAHEAE